jgi:S1-C subfamily serine protease
MITAEVWHRVVRVSCGATAGTGFILDYECEPYLVTAHHIVKGGESINVFVDGKAASVQLTPLKIPASEADVAVFRLDRPITPPGLPLTADETGMVFGQDAHFLGFPLGMAFDIGESSLPLVKRCTISGLNRTYMGRDVILLDGWNNPGFSGGPVVFRKPTAAGIHEPLQVAAIVTAYALQQGPLSVDGKIVLGAEVAMNSGIIIAERIARATDAIKAGVPLL